MAEITREQELADLYIELGDLIAPVREFCRRGQVDPNEARKVRALVVAQIPTFLGRVGRYGKGYQHEVSAINIEVRDPLVRSMQHFTYDDPTGPSITSTFLEMSVGKIRDLLALIPRQPFAGVIAAGSPYQFYRWLRAACETAQSRVVLVDQYCSPDILLRYLSAVPETAMAVFVTSASRRWQETKSASELFSIERPNSYQLRLHPNLHDRFVLVDRTAYAIGNSLKDGAVGNDCTISPGDHVAKVEEYLEEAALVHPTPKP